MLRPPRCCASQIATPPATARSTAATSSAGPILGRCVATTASSSARQRAQQVAEKLESARGPARHAASSLPAGGLASHESTSAVTPGGPGEPEPDRIATGSRSGHGHPAVRWQGGTRGIEGGGMRDLNRDFEEDVERFARSLAWRDVITYALTLPLVVLLFWWLLQR